MLQVIGFGALNVDNIFKVENLNLGENPASSIDIQPGGNAANTIFALAKLSISCGFVGIVANDAYAKLLLSEFKRKRVDISQIKTIRQATLQNSTGIVETYVDNKGRRSLFVKPGVNNLLSYEQIDPNYFKSAKFVHLTSFVNKKQLNIQKNLIKRLPSTAKISFSPGSIYCQMGLSRIEEIIKKSHVVFLEKREAHYLTKKNYKQGAKSLLKLGPEIIAITLGKDGCYITTTKQEFFKKPPKVTVVDTTGAGDAFAAGFLFGVINNYDLEKCAEIGNALASFSIRKIGARSSLPNRKELGSIVSLIK